MPLPPPSNIQNESAQFLDLAELSVCWAEESRNNYIEHEEEQAIHIEINKVKISVKILTYAAASPFQLMSMPALQFAPHFQQ